jgi:hypothetical protein
LEVPNCNFILLPIHKSTEQNVVDSSIPMCMNLQWWIYNCFQKTTNFQSIVMLFRHLKWDHPLNSLPLCVVCHDITSNGQCIGINIFPPNRLQG